MVQSLSSFEDKPIVSIEYQNCSVMKMGTDSMVIILVEPTYSLLDLDIIMLIDGVFLG